MTLLAMLRHGETAWSASGRLQGRTDIGLSDAGREALSLRRLPATCRDLQAVSSPLVRCTETAACLGLQGLRIEPRLVEMSWGDWEGQTLSVLRAQGGDAMRDNEARGLDFQPPGGESPRQVGLRLQPWLQEIGASQRATLAVSHRGVVRVVFAQAMGWDMCGKPPAKLDWSCLQLFKIDAAGRPRVWLLNLPLDGAAQAASAAPDA